MRVLVLSIFVLLSALTCLCAQTAKPEVFLKPEDVGMHKYVWQVTPQHDEIVVFYEEYWLDGKLSYKQESLRGAEREGVLCTMQVLYVDGSFFDYYARGTPEGKPTFGSIKYPGGFQRLDDCKLQAWRESGLNPGPVTLDFVRTKETKYTMKFVYDVYVESYANLKQRYPNLPPLETLRTEGWASPTKP